jgi:hypothetical protein
LRRDLEVPLASKFIANSLPPTPDFLTRSDQFDIARFDLKFAFHQFTVYGFDALSEMSRLAS